MHKAVVRFTGDGDRVLTSQDDSAPEDPRVFSQAKILVSVGLPSGVLLTLIMYFPISDYLAGRMDDIFSIIASTILVR